MSNYGWIKLNRIIREFDWYTDSDLKSLFLELLLRASHKEKTFMGVCLLPGQLIASKRTLGMSIGLPEHRIRTLTTTLTRHEQITVKATTKYSIITVVNWSFFAGGRGDDCLTLSENANNLSTIKTKTKTKNKNNSRETSPSCPVEKLEPKKRKEADKASDEFITQVVTILNRILSKSYSDKGQMTRRDIERRYKQGYKNLNDYEKVFEFKKLEWENTDMEKFLRPQTLLGSKFEGYLDDANNKQNPGMDPHDAALLKIFEGKF